MVALGASRSVDTLASQAAAAVAPRWWPSAIPTLAPELARRLPSGIEVVTGTEGLASIATVAEVVVNGVVGFAGLPVTLAALEAGRRLALANKESIIAGAPVVQRARRTPGAEIVPVDSEHCALHQCLRAGDTADEVRRLLLTASGGPFRGRRREELASVGVAEALAHPTWSMGPKITVDSSTLMNKGLEVIEAHELFGVAYDAIDVVVHPQSIVHSMVEFVDGAVVAQLSLPDMRLPIGYALSYPSRLPVAFGAIDWTRCATLEFEEPDHALFPCLDLAYQAGRAGRSRPRLAQRGERGGRGRLPQAADPRGPISRTWSQGPSTATPRRLRPPPAEASRSAPSTTCSRPTRPPGARPSRWSSDSGRRHERPRHPDRSATRPRRPGAGCLPTGPSPSPGVRPSSWWRRSRFLVALSVATGHVDLFFVILSLVAIVMVHEFGHFVAAKRSGMKVTEYFVGFGPRIWSFRRGETEYGVKALPFGGYVKIPGMTNLDEVDPADEAALLPGAVVPEARSRCPSPDRPCTSSWRSC